MIKMGFENAPEFIAALRRKPPRIVQVLTTRVTGLMFLLAGFVQARKLSGQVLKVRTGVLRGSVHALPTRVEGGKIIGEVRAAEGVAFYGQILESGVSREYQIRSVKSRALAFLSHGKTVFAKSVVHPPMLPRGFMASSELENAEKIRSEIAKALQQVIEE